VKLSILRLNKCDVVKGVAVVKMYLCSTKFVLHFIRKLNCFETFEKSHLVDLSINFFFNLQKIIQQNYFWPTLVTRVVKGCIPDRIFYPHFFPIFCFNLRKKGMKNTRKIHSFYKPAGDHHAVSSRTSNHISNSYSS
jgi:hypothetical protein